MIFTVADEEMAVADRTRTYLEMNSPAEHRPTERSSRGVTLMRVDEQSHAQVAALNHAVGAAYHWWQPGNWREQLQDPRRHCFVVHIHGAPAGLVQIQDHGAGDVEILTFGLIPEFVGRGFGGAVLDRAVETAWSLALRDNENGRVWLHTSSRDHPHALPNYRARGFRVFRRELRSDEHPPRTIDAAEGS